MSIIITPEGSEIARNLVTAVGIVLGGFWAFWKWSLSEFIRRRTEIPSMDGDISYRAIPHKPGELILSVSCKWRNASNLPIEVNTQATSFWVFEVPEGSKHGPIGPRMGNLNQVYERLPWEHWPSAVLEPGTNSELQAHFLVKAGNTYIVSCRLEAITKPEKPKQVWVRELVCTTTDEAYVDVGS